jgi:hypothetical protein
MDYKKHSLKQIETWVFDAISGDTSPQEIYDVIKNIIEEQYYYHKHHTDRCYELLALLNGNGKGHIQAYDEYLEKCKVDKVKKWILPVQVDEDYVYYIQLPYDLMRAANLEEDDQVEWIDNDDGSFKMVKVNATH